MPPKGTQKNTEGTQKRKRKHPTPTKIRPTYGEEEPDSDSDSSTLPETLSQLPQPLKVKGAKKRNLGVRITKPLERKKTSKLVKKKRADEEDEYSRDSFQPYEEDDDEDDDEEDEDYEEQPEPPKPPTSKKKNPKLKLMHPPPKAVPPVEPPVPPPTPVAPPVQVEPQEPVAPPAPSAPPPYSQYVITPLTTDQEEQVIEFVQANPVLYDKNDEFYHHKEKKEAMWKAQADAMGVSIVFSIYYLIL
jgi:hypothetical protein